MPGPEPRAANEQTLLALIDEEDRIGLADFLCSLEPKARRALNKLARNCASGHRMRNCALLAVLGTSTVAEVAKRRDLAELGHDVGREAYFRLLETLGLDWTDALVNRMLDDEQVNWLFVFEIYQRGLCRRPTHEQFRFRLLDHTTLEPDRPGHFLRDHLELLEPEIYDFFALPLDNLRSYDLEPDRLAVAMAGRPVPNSASGWTVVLPRMCDEGLLDRDRLTGCVFGALAMARKKPIVKWLGLLIDNLVGASLRDWVDRDAEVGLLPLLASSNSVVVNWSLKKLTELQKAGGLDPSPLLAGVTPVLSQSSKATVISAIKLLRRAIKKRMEFHATACLAVVEALVHAEPGVHQEVAKFLAAHAREEFRDLRLKLLEYADNIADSMRSEFSHWLTVDVEALEPTVAKLRDPAPALTDDRRLEPIAGIDELLERVSHFWHHQNDIRELNRILDALGRFAAGADDLAERAVGLPRLAETGEWIPDATGNLVIELAMAWIETSESSVFLLGQPNLIRHFLEPAYEALRRRQPFEMLSAPTHEGGWVDPRELVARIGRAEAAGRDLWRLDAAIAFLRMPREHRVEALVAAASLRSETGAALRFALGGEDGAGTPLSLWLPAARARHLSGDLGELRPKLPVAGPDGIMPARYDLHFQPAQVTPGRYQPDQPPEVWSVTTPSPNEASEELLPPALHRVRWPADDTRRFWCASMWPGNLDPFLSQSLRGLSIAVHDDNRGLVEDFCRPLFSLITAPAVPFSDLAYLATALGLSAINRSARGAAIDSLVANLEYRWFEPARLGDSIARMLNGDCLHLNRLIESFKEICAVGPLHCQRVVEAIGHSLNLELDEPPRLLNKWLEFLLERRPADHVLPERSRAWLKRLPKKGALGKTLKKLI